MLQRFLKFRKPPSDLPFALAHPFARANRCSFEVPTMPVKPLSRALQILKLRGVQSLSIPS
jgi:hypothetical protein